VSAIVSTRESPGAHTLWKLLVGAQAPDVGLIGIKRREQAVQDAERSKYAQQVLEADSSLAALQAGERVARDSCSVGQLSLCQSAELSPSCDVVRHVSEGTSNRRRDGTSWTALALV
jgi:hypothetical protein